MAVLTRIQLINEAKYRAGIEGSNVNLNTEYDMVTRDITGRYDILRGNYATGTYTFSLTDNWLTVPTGFKAVDHMKSDATTRVEVVMVEPEIFFSIAATFGSAAIPIKGCYVATDGKIYLTPFPSITGTAGAYYLWYTKYHPASTADTYSHILGEEFDETIILGLTAHACEIIEKYQRALWFRQSYEEDLSIKASVKRKRMIRVEYPDF